jgi:hypothetical protein
MECRFILLPVAVSRNRKRHVRETASGEAYSPRNNRFSGCVVWADWYIFAE